LKKYQNCCCDEKFDCICHKRCDCVQDKCHCTQKLLRDCVCVEWSIRPGGTQTIFQSGGHNRIYSSGFVSYDFGSSSSVVVRFFHGKHQIGSGIRVFEESSVAFSFTGFDRIIVECPITNEEISEVFEGQICIKTRTPVY